MLHENRRTNYLYDVPAYYVDNALQAVIDIAPASTVDAVRFLKQATAIGATHILLTPDLVEPPNPDRQGMAVYVRKLIAAGCTREVRRFETRLMWSRTLGGAG